MFPSDVDLSQLSTSKYELPEDTHNRMNGHPIPSRYSYIHTRTVSLPTSLHVDFSDQVLSADQTAMLYVRLSLVRLFIIFDK